MSSSSLFDLVRNKTNIISVVSSYMKLKHKGGSEYLGLCPFHHEKTPSFSVSGSKGFFFCFGCSASGDAIKFLSDIKNIPYKQAALQLAQTYNIEIPAQQQYNEHSHLHRLLETANDFFKAHLNTQVMHYLNSRNINQSWCQKFELGFAPSGDVLQAKLGQSGFTTSDMQKAGLINKNTYGQTYEIFRNRIIFPIRNSNQQLLGFGGRTLSAEVQPKYLNSPETLLFKKKEVLYAENLALSAAYKERLIILVEGYTDCIALHRHGFPSAVATLGTAINENITRLWQVAPEIIMCLDGDAAGYKAAYRVIDMLLPKVANDKQVSFILLPENLDPEEFLALYGRHSFAKMLERRLTLSQVIWHHITQNLGPTNTAEKRARLEMMINEVCNKVQDSVLRKNYQQFFKQACWQMFSGKERSSTRTGQNLKDLLPANLSLSDNIECSLLAFCLHRTEEPTIIEELAKISFSNQYLDNFKDFLCDNVLNYVKLAKQEVADLMIKSQFAELYNKLLKFDNVFIDRIKPHPDAQKLWQLLKLLHHQSMLQHECSTLAWDIPKLQAYHQELLDIKRQINNLSRELTE